MMDMIKGFDLVGPDTGPKKLVMSISGNVKRGKTHFALTAPGPIAIFNTDRGLKGVSSKFSDKVLYKTEIDLPPEQDLADKEFERVYEAHMDLLATSNIRSMVWDTGTDIWELARLGSFGKLEGVKSRYYGPVNAKFRRLLRASLKSDKNLIVIQRLKHVYINDVRQKKMEPTGFPETGSWMEVVGRIERPGDNDDYEDNWVFTIEDCGFNPALNGQVLVGEDVCSFPFLASMVFPDTLASDWT